MKIWLFSIKNNLSQLFRKFPARWDLDDLDQLDFFRYFTIVCGSSTQDQIYSNFMSPEIWEVGQSKSVSGSWENRSQSLFFEWLQWGWSGMASIWYILDPHDRIDLQYSYGRWIRKLVKHLIRWVSKIYTTLKCYQNGMKICGYILDV